MFAGHKEAMVKEYDRKGGIDKVLMRSLDAVRPECQRVQTAKQYWGFIR